MKITSVYMRFRFGFKLTSVFCAFSHAHGSHARCEWREWTREPASAVQWSACRSLFWKQ